MSNQSRSQLLEYIHLLENVNISQTPNYRMMLTLRNAISERGIPVHVANRIVTTMTLNVSEVAINDTDLVNRVVSVYADTLSKLNAHLEQDFGDADQMLISMAASMHIEMDF